VNFIYVADAERQNWIAVVTRAAFLFIHIFTGRATGIVEYPHKRDTYTSDGTAGIFTAPVHHDETQRALI